MIRFMLIIPLVGCDPAKAVFEEIAVLDTGMLNTSDQTEIEGIGEPASEVSTEPTSEPESEPSGEASSEPANEVSTEPTSEPAQEEDPPPTDFSEFVEDELGIERGSSGLDSIEPDLSLWLDSAQMSTLVLDATGNIERWENRNGTLDHAEQIDSSVRPFYNTNQGMVEFNGNHYFLVDNQNVDVSATYFVVYSGSDPVGTLFAKANETGIWSQGGKTFFIRDGKYTTDVGWVGFVNATSMVSNSLSSVATFEHRESGDQDQHLIYHNGVLELDAVWAYNTFPEAQLTDGGVFKIGYTSTDFPQSHGLFGSIGELIKIDQTLTDEHRMMVHAYLASKWGLQSEMDSDSDGASDNVDSAPTDPSSN